jgi:cytochrome c oxidase subunit II
LENVDPVKASRTKSGSASKISRPAYCSALIVAMAVLMFPAIHGYTQDDTPAITIHAKRYEFVPAEITLTAGKPVKLIFIADDVAHGIAIEGLLPDRDINPGKPETVILTPSKAGDFPGECSLYCGAGHERMKFLVHVVE